MLPAGDLLSIVVGGAGNTGDFGGNWGGGGGGGSFVFASALSSVPEPATWGMMLLGFGFAGVAMRRRVRVRYSAA
ncbi:MAG: PEPxxWA-CTERM sorting domain-containing protein [Sphingomonadales bacterium]|nr:PEPxxWA-CTERM sorting domain-containing protein [Sphingomonadales bacterium]